ncbi:MAG: hypothetical protein HYS33_04495 [Acidobacteria bacterium]|nr:hypothetical protein [Acidobacteriota bacterium]
MTNRTPSTVREMVLEVVAGELLPGASLPDDDADLEDAGCLDSMGWVGVLSRIEEITGIRNLGAAWPQGRPRSVRALVGAVLVAVVPGSGEKQRTDSSPQGSRILASAYLAGWGSAFGSLTVDAAAIEAECDLETGTLRERAGTESVCRVRDDEDEVTLGQRAAERALRSAELALEDVDLLVAISTTFLRIPSFAPTLHSRLLLKETCAALDVGGACAGLIYGLAAAKGVLATSHQRTALVVAAEVHSRRLAAPNVPGEFRGLFGDAACALLLKMQAEGESGPAPRLREFVWGCDGSLAAALQVAVSANSEIEVGFRGEQLGSAATSQLLSVLRRLESLSGRKLVEVDAVALHEPNPRLVEILARKAGIPIERLPLVSRTHGNLGAATCGVGLSKLLDGFRVRDSTQKKPILFLAAVGPGLVWAGTYLD